MEAEVVVSEVVVVVAVSPQLLSDTVRRALHLQGIVTADARPGGRSHIAVVTDDRSAEVDADTVITLVGEGGPVDGAGRVRDLLGLRAALAPLLPREPA